MGHLQFTPEEMTSTEAQRLLDAAGDIPYFDYVKGRAMKVNLGKGTLSTALYNRDNGDQAAEWALQPLLDKSERKV